MRELGLWEDFGSGGKLSSKVGSEEYTGSEKRHRIRSKVTLNLQVTFVLGSELRARV